MSHITIYLDPDSLKKVETAAKVAKSSVSKWVRSKLIKELSSTWPEGYFNLFGSLKGTSLERPSQPSLLSDVKRETF